MRRLLGAPPVATEGTTSATRLHRTSVVQVGADLCVIDSRELLVVCDYYSNYIEVSRLTRATSSSVIRVLKEIFARYGVPDTLVTDNGTQFASAEFAVFARTWSFDHVTSSPRYPQSNGKVENAVKTVKQLFTKCRQSGQSEFPSAVRLAQHPDGRNADKPSTTTDGPPVQDAATDRRSTTSAPLFNRTGRSRCSGPEGKTGVLLQQEDQAAGADRAGRKLSVSVSQDNRPGQQAPVSETAGREVTKLKWMEWCIVGIADNSSAQVSLNRAHQLHWNRSRRATWRKHRQ